MVEFKAERVLIRFGELSNKGKNRKLFVKQLIANLKSQLAAYPEVKYKNHFDRIMVELNGAPEDKVIDLMRHVFGIRSISPVVLCDADMDTITQVCLHLMQKEEVCTFKVMTNRKDKHLPYSSDALNRSVATAILQNTEHKVDVHKPDLKIKIDVDMEKAAISTRVVEGAGGFPIGVGGKALLLLSGGIDSPVAAYHIMRRGVEVECIHFAAPPYTTIQALDKVKQLAEILTAYQAKLKLHIVPFTDIQMEIYKQAGPDYGVILMRRSMMHIAEVIAENNKCLALVTGENLGQVASQTLQSMHAIEADVDALMLRPLLSLEKNEIIDQAKKIGTYETSILPYEDCCTIFKVVNPVTKPKLKIVRLEEAKCDLLDKEEIALANIETFIFPSREENYL